MSGEGSILIVDDDATAGEPLARQLELRGYRARVATTGEEAIARLTEEPCDLLVADLELPGADAVALFRRVRASHPALPVILLAAPGRIEEAIDAMRQGVEDFLAKPAHAAELVHRLRAILDRRALLSENAELRKRLPPREAGDPGPGSAPSPPEPPGAGEEGRLVDRLMNSEISFEQFERELLLRALRRTRGNQSGAARLLGMTRRTLQYRIAKFGIDTTPLRE